MSTKYIYSISDETPDLKKQIGCMNGIFQLFDRHYLLGSSRRLLGQNHKRLPSSGKSSSHELEIKGRSKNTKEKDHNKNALKEKQRVSTESSRTSFSSSSCSSSLSSVECRKTSQVESSSVNKSVVPELYARESALYQVDITLQARQQSANIQDVVKDSLYREARGVSVKIATKGTAGRHTLMYIDSPRPFQHSKFVDPRIPGLKESVQVLQKLQEVPRKSNEGKRAPLSTSFRDAPRFSYDGRESKDSLKSTVRLKELPRLSLDSRAGSVRGSNAELKLNSHLGNSRRGHEKVNDLPKQEEDPGSHKQQSSIVAKLMGLESLPDPILFNENQASQHGTRPDAENCYAGSAFDDNKQNQIPVSPRSHRNEPMSPRKRNSDLLKTSAASSKVLIEPAPWRQLDGNKSSSASASKNCATRKTATNSSPSVYGEIEKRLAQLEFKRSGKDLRALKQILEAMQKTRKTLETRNEASDFVNETDSRCSQHQSTRSAKLQNLQTSSSPVAGLNKGSSSPKSFKSSIVIMKPNRLIEKPANLPSSAEPIAGLSGLHRLRTRNPGEGKKESTDKQAPKGLTPRTKDKHSPSNQPYHLSNKSAITQCTRLTQTPTTRESNDAKKISTTMKLRQQHKKIGFQKQNYHTTPVSESRRANIQRSQQVAESHSQNRQSRPKSSNMHRNDDELSDISVDTRSFSNQSDLISSKSESYISMASQVDDEVSSTYNSHRVYSKTQQTHGTKQHDVERSMTDKPTTVAVITSTEQPSPVSVLDAAFYGDELPSPVKKISVAFEGEEELNSDEEFNLSSGDTNSAINSAISLKSAEKMEPLIRNLKHVDMPIIQEISSIYGSMNSDHHYIAEILSASGILKDSESSSITTSLLSTAFLIDPELFIIIEQAKASTTKSDEKHFNKRTSQLHYHAKVERKLVFDVVAEILENKFSSQGSSTPWLLAKSAPGEQSKGDHLLRELRSEVDRLKDFANGPLYDEEEDILENILCEDTTKQSTKWMAFHHEEMPRIVLDVERLIFKDLVTEFITGDAMVIQGRAARHCRQLFCK